MYLDQILGSKTKVNILSALVQNKEKSFMESELAKKIGSSVSEVNRQIVDLVNVGLVRMERVGKAKMYCMNKKHFLFIPLAKLFEGLNEKYKEAARKIVHHITNKYRIIAVMLFGSLTKGKIKSDFVREPSDIDIVVIAGKKDLNKIREDLTSFINKDISTEYGIVAYPVVLSSEDYIKRLDKDKFIINVYAQGEVIYGKKPRRFS